MQGKGLMTTYWLDGVRPAVRRVGSNNGSKVDFASQQQLF